MSHANAPLTPEGRRRLCQRVDAGRAICHVAAEAGVSRQTLGKWYARWQESGMDGLSDHSSAPDRHPNQTSREVEDLVEELGHEGITVVMSTHNLGQAKRLATRVAYLEGGHLMAEAPTAFFFNSTLPPEAAAFLRGENVWL